MSAKEEIVIFDDGSLESKVMQHELKNTYKLNVFQVKPYTKLDIWLAETIDETDEVQKIFLHFPFEDYIDTKKDIRTEIQEAGRKYPLLRVIPWYEQTHKDAIQNRANSYGVTAEQPKPEPDPIEYIGVGTNDPFKSK